MHPGLDLNPLLHAVRASLEITIDLSLGTFNAITHGLNPLSFWVELPAIGPVFGHDAAYAMGGIVGQVASIAAQIYLGSVAMAGAGWAECGGLVQQAVRLYSTVSEINNITQAVSNISNGTAGPMDYLAVAAPFIGLGFGGIRILLGNGFCFAGETEFRQPALVENATEVRASIDWVGVALVGIAFGSAARLRRGRAEEDAAADRQAIERLFGLGLVLDGPSPGLPPDYLELLARQQLTLEKRADRAGLLAHAAIAAIVEADETRITSTAVTKCTALPSQSGERICAARPARYNRPPGTMDMNDARPQSLALRQTSSLAPATANTARASRSRRALWLAALVLSLVGVAWRGATGPAMRADVAQAEAAAASRAKPIRDVQLGERGLGVNPLRHEVDAVLPDERTWRRIDLRFIKPSGRSLWVSLLRPREWLAEVGAAVGRSIEMRLDEFGDVGELEVLAIGPCPPIEPGAGPIVIGKFIHEADGDEVIALLLAGETQPTLVTSGHRYWSLDRQAFIAAGSLLPGEAVDTERLPGESAAGPRGRAAVVSASPVRFAGLLYNLETTEHVYRIGHLGTLVHNAWCGSKVLTGQIHHPISVKVARELENHPDLNGQYQARDPRFTTQAVDAAAQRGYQHWHRDLNKEIVQWLKDPKNKHATRKDFEEFLRLRYSQLDLLALFPNGF